jgi:tetratricopeptide (TPR) repeat protein
LSFFALLPPGPSRTVRSAGSVRFACPARIGALALIALAAAFAVLPRAARADTAFLSDGRRIEGSIVKDSPERLEMITRGGRLTISRTEATWRIERDTPARNTLREVDSALRRDSLLDAEKGLREAMSEGLALSEARRWCVAHEKPLGKAFEHASRPDIIAWSELTRSLTGLTTATLPANAPADPPSVPDGWTTATLLSCQSDALPTSASHGARPFRPAPPGEQRDFILLMTRILSPTDERQVAIALLEGLDDATLRGLIPAAPFVEPLLIKEISLRLATADFRRAGELMRLLEGANLASAKPCRLLAVLRWSSLARESLEFDRALEVLRSHVAPVAPSLASERMVATLVDARRRLPAQGRYADAIGLYERWGAQLPDANTAGAIASLYHDWGEELLAEGQPSEARAALTEYLRRKPDGDDSVLAVCDFQERFAALGPASYADCFRLGQWAVERDLVPQAIVAFERAAGREELREPATEQIQLLRQNAARAHLDRCLKWLERGEPQQALDELGKFPFYPETRTLLPEMQRLRKACSAEIARRAGLRPVQAEALYQDAERRFGLGERDAAVKDLRTILKDYADTPAADRAHEFLGVATAHMLLETLEGSASAAGAGAPLAVGATRGSEDEVHGLLHDLGQGAETGRPAATAQAPSGAESIDAPSAAGEADLF